jgi:hypothetical protein
MTDKDPWLVCLAKRLRQEARAIEKRRNRELDDSRWYRLSGRIYALENAADGLDPH